MSKIRRMEEKDIKRCLEIENEAWIDPLAKEYSFTEEHFKELISVYPDGQFVVEEKGNIVGFTNTQLINFEYQQKEIKTWAQICNTGFISKTHNPDGDTLFGINLSFSKEATFLSSGKLMTHVLSFMVKSGLKGIILGSRIPFYHKYAEEMSVEEYVYGKRKSGKPLDPELRIYTKFGAKIINIIPDYFPDYESLNYGVLLILKNPLHLLNKKTKDVVITK